MSDDKTKTDPENARPISLTEAYGVAYGKRKFGESDQCGQAEATPALRPLATAVEQRLVGQ